MIVNKQENRLIHEKSPYLLQHAHNPVDWYPWGEEAFRRAQAQDKPVFLSVGYSACHWCHVMERESFEDMEVAAVLNEFFIPVKVDREERPDVDAVYMKACQAMTGAGGWPMTIVMTPDQMPFFAATYLPKYERAGSMGLLDVLYELARQWKTSRERLLSAGAEISRYLRRDEEEEAQPGEPSRELLKSAAAQLKSVYDATWGGFGGAPKFPTPHNLLFLLRYAEEEGDAKAREMAQFTLERMYRGGIFDHVGGGFSRYSTDRKWLVPHFEKMLYDNALITISCLEAYRQSKRELFAEIARRTLDYVLREMTDETGGFYCAQDADSDGEEGKYYTFTPEEVKQILAEHDGEDFCRRYGITKTGNFMGGSIPNLLDSDEFEREAPKMEELRRKLHEYRQGRRKLPLDDKILTAWNALMAAAMVRAGRILREPRYLTAGRQALRFVENRLTASDGRLKVRYREGDAAGEGHLDDYAFYAWALLELYRATLDADDLSRAVEVADRMCALFLDKTHGGFYLTAHDGEQLISRPKETHDGAMPSGNSVAALVLERLWRLTGETVWRDRSDLQMKFLAGKARSYPSAYCFALLAMEEAIYPAGELLCTTGETEAPQELLDLMEREERLHILLKTPENEALLKKFAPFTAACPIPARGAGYYLCKNGACAAPTDDIAQVRAQIAALPAE